MGLNKARVLKITPVQATKATGTFTYLGTVATGQLLAIGSEVYQAAIDGNAVTTGNIAFATSMGATSATSVIDSLVARINASGVIATAVTGVSGRILTVEYNTPGTVGNAIYCSATLTGTWTTTSLAGAIEGTFAAKGTIAVDATYLYFTKADNDVSDQNWYVVTGTLLT